jgi:iron-sulfur cluster assembly protein
MSAIPVTITEAAAAKIKTVVKTPQGALKLSLKSGGCAGMSYQMDILDDAEGAGTLIEAFGARVVIDPLVEMFMFGTEIDYQDTLLQSGFVFKNPNATASCGCGESVGF